MSLIPYLTGLSMDDLTQGLTLYGQGQAWDQWLLTAQVKTENLAQGMFLLQALTTLGFFVLPGFWLIQNRMDGRALNQRHPLGGEEWWGRLGYQVMLSIVGLLALLPLVYTLYHGNQALRLLSDSYPWIDAWVQAELEAARIVSLLLDQNSIPLAAASVLVLVLLPALGEELIFRGVLQPVLGQIWGRPQVAIWVSAVIFSAIHGQWLGFMPRCLLGALFGYLAYWSGSLWPAVGAHLANNGLSLMAYRWNWLNARTTAVDFQAPFQWNDAPVVWWIVLPATFVGFWLLKQFYNRSQPPSQRS